jgi:hypothetical protein
VLEVEVLRYELPRRHVHLGDELLDHRPQLRPSEDENLARLLQRLNRNIGPEVRARHLLQGLLDPLGDLRIRIDDAHRLRTCYRLRHVQLRSTPDQL